jgi:hypothetical protein
VGWLLVAGFFGSIGGGAIGGVGCGWLWLSVG